MTFVPDKLMIRYPGSPVRRPERRAHRKEGDELKLLAIMRPIEGVDARTEVARHAEAELRALGELYRDGFVREMYSPAGPGAVLVREAESAEDAERRVSQFPLVTSDVMSAEILELRPFAAIEMLFGGAPPP